jgi:hypothetical protein
MRDVPTRYEWFIYRRRWDCWWYMHWLHGVPRRAIRRWLGLRPLAPSSDEIVRFWNNSPNADDLFDKKYGLGSAKRFFFRSNGPSGGDADILDLVLRKEIKNVYGGCYGEPPKVRTPNACGLSESEHVALEIYLAETSWREKVNAGARAAERKTPFAQSFACLVNEALVRLPVLSGECYRGVSVDDLTRMVATYRAGTVHVWNDFISATASLDGACAGNVLFIIAVKEKGRLLGDYAARPQHAEILFATESVFDVRAIERRKEFLVIFLEEQEPLPPMEFKETELTKRWLKGPGLAGWLTDRSGEQAWRADRAGEVETLLAKAKRLLGLHDDDDPTATTFSRGAFSEGAAHARDAFFAHKAANPHVKSFEEMSPLEQRMQSGSV